MKIYQMHKQGKYYVRYFNGFSLKNEESLFSEYTVEGDFCISGFSCGAQGAFDYVYNTKERIDRLILLSPAFFQTRDMSFLRTEERYFKNAKKLYIKQFLQNVAYPSNTDLSKYLKVGTNKDLEELLMYIWDKKKIKEVSDRGVIIEVFIGSEDKIIDAQEVFDFFSDLAVTHIIKDVGHLLN